MAHEPIKTKAGTQLPLIDLKGKPYLQVAHRLVWFREEHGDWSIDTDITGDETVTLAKATIKDETGRVIATAHKREHKVHFQDHAEKAETGAIGRALALCGYGTQFAPDMDEGDSIVDSPVARPTKSAEPEYATEKQVMMLAKLKQQLGLPPLDIEKMGAMTKAQASTYIDQMMKKVDEQNATPELVEEETPPSPRIPNEINLDEIDFS